jgi:hypothetical protein
MRVSVPKLLDVALAIFYQSLTKGEIPNVNRLKPSPKKWPEFLAQIKGQGLDKFFLFDDGAVDLDEDELDQIQFNAVHFKTTAKNKFEVIFAKVDGKWVINRIDWYRDPKNGLSIDYCF